MRGMGQEHPCAYDHFFVRKLIFSWSGSLWQLIKGDIALYIVIYVSLATIYIAAMATSPQYRLLFESLAHWVQQIRLAVPLSFLLGFYVATVIGRWWSAIAAVPYVQGAACTVLSMVTPPSADKIELASKIRCSLIRYMNLGWIMVMCEISEAVRLKIAEGLTAAGAAPSAAAADQRHSCKSHSASDSLSWPQLAIGANHHESVRQTFGVIVTDEDLHEAELLRLRHYASESKEQFHPPIWFPRVRALQLLQSAYEANFVQGERSQLQLVKSVNEFFGSVGSMYMFSVYKIPLVYTQVVVIAVYTYVYSGVIATQLLDSHITGVGAFTDANETVAIFQHSRLLMHFFPITGLLEFVFYIGWFKIGMVLLDPFGRELADIPLCNVLDFNLRSGYEIVTFPKFDNPLLLQQQEEIPQQVLQNVFHDLPPTKLEYDLQSDHQGDLVDQDDDLDQSQVTQRFLIDSQC